MVLIVANPQVIIIQFCSNFNLFQLVLVLWPAILLFWFTLAALSNLVFLAVACC